MRCLIERVTLNARLGRENIATELLADFLRAPQGRDKFKDFLQSRFTVNPPKGWIVSPQKSIVKGSGIPDIHILQEDESIWAIIESKFWAPLTGHQRDHYFELIPPGGIFLIIAPDIKRRQIYDEMRIKHIDDLCEKHTCWFTSKDKSLAVITWTEITECLGNNNIQSSYTHDLYQFGRFCNVLEKEVFEDLTDNQLKNEGVANLISHLRWLADKVALRCIDDGFMKAPDGRVAKQKNKWDMDGRNLNCGEIPLWIGFYPEAWNLHKVSPLWIWIKEGSLTDENRKNLKKNLGIQLFLDKDDALLIPLPVLAGTTQDQNVTQLANYIRDFCHCLGST
jgi:hypothetical protein